MGAVELIRLTAADWAGFREIRLAALADSPSAYCSSLEREERLPEAEWRLRLRRGVTFAAMASGERVGIVTGLPGDLGTGAELVGMWVHPAWRRRGVGRLLVDAVIQWATERDQTSLSLWVIEGNAAAEALYARQGFVRTGATDVMGEEGPGRVLVEMSRSL